MIRHIAPSIVAVALMLGEASETPSRAPVLIQAGGLAAVALAVWLYDESTAYPGIAAALPAIGAVAARHRLSAAPRDQPAPDLLRGDGLRRHRAISRARRL